MGGDVATYLPSNERKRPCSEYKTLGQTLQKEKRARPTAACFVHDREMDAQGTADTTTDPGGPAAPKSGGRHEQVLAGQPGASELVVAWSRA